MKSRSNRRSPRNWKIRNKFFLVMLSVCVALSLLLATASLLLFRSSYYAQSEEGIRRNARQFISVLERRLNDMNNVMFTLAMNFNVRTVLSDSYSNDYERYLSITSSMQMIDLAADIHEGLSLYLFNAYKGILLSSKDYSERTANPKNLARFSWFQRLAGDMDNEYFVLSDFTLSEDDTSAKELALALRVRLGSAKVGFVIVSITQNSVKELFGNVMDFQSDAAIVYTDSGDVVYRALEPSMAAAEQLVRSYGDGEYPISVGNADYILSVHSLPAYGIRSALLFRQTYLTLGFQWYLRVFIVVLSVVFVIVLLLSFTVANSLTQPIRKLTRSIDAIEHLNSPKRIDPPANDETGQLAMSINRMLERIDQLVENLMEQQELKRIAEIESLSHQINPHFLYNILETINSIAEVYMCPEISLLSNRMSRMFRYSLSGGAMEKVLFSEELRHVEEYIAIQQVRFPNRVRLALGVDEATNKLYTLKFLLQPIVENAIIHGIEDRMDGGTVTLTAKCIDGALEVLIQDDGNGMQPETLAELRASLQRAHMQQVAKKRPHIGLINVHRRIQLAFGEAYGITITSAPAHGTSVRLWLPVLKEADG